MHGPVRLLALALLIPATAGAAPPAAGWKIPIEVKTLPNGLTVVVSEDHTAPTFGICTAYRIGFRLEPKGRAGFAHLFEHMMFEGTPVAPKGTLTRVIEGGGGMLNGRTRSDYTYYIASAPTSALDAMLWLEADRMKHLDLSEKNLKNQQEVVKEEIRANVQNRPYGSFYWTDLAGKAFDKWENAHDGYGSFEDLDWAKLKDVEAFYRSYYGPNNAVMALVGDVTTAEVFAKVEKYFGALPSRPVPPLPDVSEGLNTAERTLEQTDALARVPAIAVGYKMPARGSRDHVPAAVLGDLLLSGEASRLYQGLVKGKELLLEVQGGMNWPLGDAWSFSGPTLMTMFALYQPTTSAKGVADAIHEEIQKIARQGIPGADLARVKTKMRSDFYNDLELPMYRANSMALNQLLTGSAAFVNEVPGKLEAVTSADVQRVASTYLTVANRTVVDRKPAAAPAAAQK
jgi:zinc protease